MQFLLDPRPMQINRAIRFVWISAAAAVLSACVSAQEDMAEAPVEETPNEVNSGDNVTRNNETGAETSIGFSAAVFPGTRTGVVAPNTTIGDPSSTTPTALAGIGAVTPVSVLTFNSSTGAIASANASYDPATIEATVGSDAFSVNADGAGYAARLINGGNNLAIVVPTPLGALPGGRATYNGTGDVVYVNAPTAQTFTGTMSARIEANFAIGSVDMSLRNPNGTIDGVAYSNGGTIEIDDMVVVGTQFRSSGATTGSVTGFTGASDLNSGAQTVNALGLFGGPNGEEAAAIAQITDGANGTAIMRVTGSR